MTAPDLVAKMDGRLTYRKPGVLAKHADLILLLITGSPLDGSYGNLIGVLIQLIDSTVVFMFAVRVAMATNSRDIMGHCKHARLHGFCGKPVLL